jgi:hypothetical protein
MPKTPWFFRRGRPGFSRIDPGVIPNAMTFSSFRDHPEAPSAGAATTKSLHRESQSSRRAWLMEPGAKNLVDLVRIALKIRAHSMKNGPSILAANFGHMTSFTSVGITE